MLHVMEREQYIGVASEHDASIAFERWFKFMAWPGFGWVGLLSMFVAPQWVASIVIYLTLYASLAYAWPGSFASFWVEIGKLAPAKARELIVSATKLLGLFCELAGKVLKRLHSKAITARVERWTEARNAIREQRRPTAPVHMMMGLGGQAPTFAAPAPPPRPDHQVDWGKFGAALLDWRFWACVIVGLTLLGVLYACSGDGPFAPSGREVAADARAHEADARTREASATAGQQAHTSVIVEERHARLDQIHADLEQTRDALQANSDFDARFERYRSFSERMRADAARDYGIAVSDYRSSIDP